MCAPVKKDTSPFFSFSLERPPPGIQAFIFPWDLSPLMHENPMELFVRECPGLAKALEGMVDAQRSLEGMDDKTRQLVNLAIQTANRNPRGVFFHSRMAREAGARRSEVIGAVVMNLHLSGLAPVLDCLPAAVEGYGSD